MPSNERDKQLRAELAAELGWYPADLDDESIARHRADAARKKTDHDPPRSGCTWRNYNASVTSRPRVEPRWPISTRTCRAFDAAPTGQHCEFSALLLLLRRTGHQVSGDR